MDNIFQDSILHAPMFHGTGNYFDTFSHTTDIGYHFGTLNAAKDRMTTTGHVDLQKISTKATKIDIDRSNINSFNKTQYEKVYAVLLRVLDNPQLNLLDTLETMSDVELDQIYAEYHNKPTSDNFADSLKKGINKRSYSIYANGELIFTSYSLDDTNQKYNELKQKTQSPRSFWLNIKNPIKMDDLGKWSVADIAKQIDLNNIELHELYDSDDRYAWLRNKIKSLGYDSIEYENAIEDIGSVSYIVFDPEQIKEI